MYSLLRSCRSPLKRTVCLAPTCLFGKPYKFNRPLVLQVARYCKAKGDGEKPPMKAKPEVSKDAGGDSKKPAEPQVPGDPKDPGDPSKQPVVGPKFDIQIMQAPYFITDYDERNMKKGRVLSPHLSIYKIQLTSAMSIFLRISGFILGCAIWVIGLTGLCCDMDINQMAEKIESCSCGGTLFKILKFCIMMPFAYHVMAGTRHLLWYLNIFLTKKEVYATGYVAAVLALVLAVSLASIEVKTCQRKPSKVSHEGGFPGLLLDEEIVDNDQNDDFGPNEINIYEEEPYSRED